MLDGGSVWEGSLPVALWSRQVLGLWAEGDKEGISHQRAPHPACWPRSDACLEKRTGKGKADRSLGERSPGERAGVLFASITQDASHGLRRMSAWPWPGLSGSGSAFAWAGSLEQGAGCRVSFFSSLGT